MRREKELRRFEKKINLSLGIIYSLYLPSLTITMASASNGGRDTSPKRTFTIGTRSSELALLQADIVANVLRKARPDCKFEILSKKTAGDRNKVIALQEFAAKNLWTEELEELLIVGKVDFIVHSLKGDCA